MTNVEKQERYRKKEALKKMAGEIAMQSMLQANPFQNFAQGKNPAELQKELQAIIDLPSNWTDENYNNALKRLQNINLETFDNHYLLETDINENHNSVDNFASTPNPAKYVSDIKTAKANDTKLVNHILSAVELSGLSTADAIAGTFEVIRTLIRILKNEPKIPQSNATALASLMLSHQFGKKPEWVIERASKALGTQLGEEDAHRLGEALLNFRM